MVVENTRALISYDDGRSGSNKNTNYSTAQRCARLLREKRVEVEVSSFRDSILGADTQWLILVHSGEINKNAAIASVVDTALDRVVTRQMRDVVAITTQPSDLRPEWASMRKYDASAGREDAALRDMLHAMEQVKIPYNQAINQQRSGKIWSEGGRIVPLVVAIVTMVVILLVVASAVMFLPGLLHPTPNAAFVVATTTARARANAGKPTPTATVQGIDQVTQTKMQTTLKTLTRSNPTTQGFQAADQWEESVPPSVSSCSLANTAYIVNMSDPNRYKPCLAAKPVVKNFVMQVTMTIQGDAGGVIFRANNGTYYRLAVNQSDATTPTIDTFSLVRCDANCAQNSVASGTSLTDNTNTAVTVDRNVPFMLALIARDNTFDIFINGQFVASVTDPASKSVLPGQIGLYAASLGNNTTVNFTNLKVWKLPDNQKAQPTSQPTQSPIAQPSATKTQGP